MYIIKYFYFERKPGTMEENTFKQHDGEVTADTLKGAMLKFYVDGTDHDLSKYGTRRIYDVINTDE